MSKEIINIGCVSKGRLKIQSEQLLKRKKLKIFFDRGERELIGKVKGRQDISVSFMHAREILDQLSIGNLDIGISGLDLLKESEVNVQKKFVKLGNKIKTTGEYSVNIDLHPEVNCSLDIEILSPKTSS